MISTPRYKCIVIGVSSGGMNALSKIIPSLPREYPIPVIVVQHISPNSDNYMTRYLDSISNVSVKEVDEKESLQQGFVYTAPPNYHVLIEDDETLSLSVEDRINFARPSVDVLFESAADVFGHRLIGIILTGANNDGSLGLKKIKDKGGLVLIQDPDTSEVNGMPSAALSVVKADHVLQLDEIGPFLVKIAEKKASNKKTERP